MDYLVLAKQQASKAKGMVFYVTDKWIKQSFQLFGAKWDYKVYFKNGVYVEDSKGKIIEKPEKKGKKTISQDMRNIADGEVRENDK